MYYKSDNFIVCNMENIENDLLYALKLTRSQRIKTHDLNTGYDSDNGTWKIIVKLVPYGSNDKRIWINNPLIISTVFIDDNYAVIVVKEEGIMDIAAANDVLYVAKSNKIGYLVANGKRVSCINEVQRISQGIYEAPVLNLTGRGTIVGVIDSGIDYTHPSFIGENGQSRIIGIWDQTASWNGENEQEWIEITGGLPAPPQGFNTGIYYPQEWINYTLSRPVNLQSALLPEFDPSGHGTAVTGIAAGGAVTTGTGQNLRGVAYEADILFVKAGVINGDVSTGTARIIEGLSFLQNFAAEQNKPLSVNISYGNSEGPHNGRSFLETYIDDIAGRGKNNIVIGTGNEGDKALHYEVNIANGETALSQFSIAATQQNLSLQLWKNYYDEMNIYFILPDGQRVDILPERRDVSKINQKSIIYSGMEIVIFNAPPTPYNIMEEIRIEFLRDSDRFFLTEGIYSIEIEGVSIKNGMVNMWMPSGSVTQSGTRFLNPSPDTTLTIPSGAYRGLSVAAYDSRSGARADYSGRGFLTNGLIKPDICAPGTDIVAPAPRGGYSIYTGTSFATPFVTGACALLAQWGIIDGNDNDLYGEKAKAFLIKGAKRLSMTYDSPDRSIGWGALCVSLSLPGFSG